MDKTITLHKFCHTCKTEKTTDMFHKRLDRKNGLQSKCKECTKLYVQNNNDKISAYNIEYNTKNKEKISEYHRNNSLKNKEKINEYQKQYYQDNKESIKKLHLEYYQNNKENLYKQRKEYSKTSMGIAVRKNIKHRYRSDIKKGDVTNEQLIQLQQTAKVCYWCKMSLSGVKIHLDHYDPLSKGGLHTISNLVVSCSTCNQNKSAKNPIIFANSIGRLL